MWKILQWFSNKPPYYCTHREKGDPQFWECTYSHRAGRGYIHIAEGRIYIPQEDVDALIERLKKWHT